ncbi:MAG: hypothetical protein AAB601_02955, partial [Patescibacteria group bacterium]
MKLAGFLLFFFIVVFVACIAGATLRIANGFGLLLVFLPLAFVSGVFAAYILYLFGFGHLASDAGLFRLKV